MSVQGRNELAVLPLTSAPATIREHCCALLHVLDQQIRGLDVQLTQQWAEDSRVHRLTSIPGIGPFVATVLVLELGDIHRFPSAKHLASYVGLTPRIRASADRIRLGHISKEGNRLLRWVLVLAATQRPAGQAHSARGTELFKSGEAETQRAWRLRAALPK